MEQQEEIKQLRAYLRDIFDKEEEKIVGMSYDETIGAAQGSLSPEGNDANSDNIAIKDGQFGPAGSTFSP